LGVQRRDRDHHLSEEQATGEEVGELEEDEEDRVGELVTYVIVPGAQGIDVSDVVLVRDTAPVLCPMRNRTPGPPGTHLSEIIRDLCIKTGQFDEEGVVNQADLEFGSAVEFAIINRMKLDEPGMYFVPGELELHGVYGHPDLARHQRRKELMRSLEIKCTWMSAAKHGPFSEKFWKFEVQNKGYLKMLQELFELSYPPPGELHVVYPRGDYSRNQRSTWKTWLYPWTQWDLDSTWDMLIQHRDLMRQEQGLMRELLGVGGGE
jgi:hypothetical protein